MTPTGFEPAPPKRTELESVALDHSAMVSVLFLSALFDANQIKSLGRKIIAVNTHKKPSAGLEPAALRLKVLCSTD